MNFITFPKDATLPKDAHVKFGIDPTSHRMHLGHLVPLRVVKILAQKGHPVTIVFGTFTAQMGDPSGQDKTRPMLEAEVVRKNADALKEQVGRIMGELLWEPYNNGDELEKWSARQFMTICSKFTTSRLLSRDGFQRRLQEQKPVHLHELIVPLCQAWDSVALNAAIEVGGEDQLFNFQLTRELQAIYNQSPEVCILTPVINGTDGRKMSKSLGNCIFLDDTPEDVFGKCMSVSDEVMREWIPLLTDIKPLAGDHPLSLKKQMAFAITTQIWGPDAAWAGQLHFEKVCQEGSQPKELKKINSKTLIEAVIAMRGISKTAARRLLQEGGASVNDKKVSAEHFLLSPGMIVRIGKRDYAEVGD